MFEVAIVGGGISGLYVALKLCKHRSVILLDDRDYIGGRIRTHRNPQYEIGAGRFTEHHSVLMKLVRKYRLEKVELPTDVLYLDKNKGYIQKAHDYFDSRIRRVLMVADMCCKEYLQTMSFHEFCKSTLVDEDIEYLMHVFGYRCEFDYLNAYDACQTFKKDFSGQKFFALKNGLSTLCTKMEEEIKRNGGKVCLNQRVESVKRTSDGHFTLQTSSSHMMRCHKVVFAVKPHQMIPFEILSPVCEYLSSVRPGQLLRIYATFPTGPNGPWFKRMKKTTTNSFLRQIIPISHETGLIMISYTDGEDVNFFLQGSDLRDDIQSVVMEECRRLFGSTIPDPIDFKSHYWSEGCHYWRPNYDSDAISQLLTNPCENVYTCGEGFSKNQCWMEGALASAERVVRSIQSKNACVSF